MNYHTIKQLPDSERPYEKCKAKGVVSLSDAELLAVCLKTGYHGCNCVELARTILDSNPAYQDLTVLNHLTYQELIAIPGIGSVKAIQILCISELAKRLSMTEARKKIQLNSAVSIANYFMEELRHRTRECIIVAMFDGQYQLIGYEKLSEGIANASMTSPKEVFQEALHYHAVYIVLLHNHPSGIVTPSNEDILLTKHMKQAGELLGIPLTDHIIIGNRKYISLREEGYW